MKSKSLPALFFILLFFNSLVFSAEAFDKVFGNAFKLADMRTLTAAVHRLNTYLSSDNFFVKDHVSSGYYLFMPNPGANRLGTNHSVTIDNASAIYFDVYGDFTIKKGKDNEIYFMGTGWRSINIVNNKVCENDNCISFDRLISDQIEIAPKGGALSNVQYYEENTWHRLKLNNTLTESLGGLERNTPAWERLSQKLFQDAFIIADAFAMCKMDPSPAECLSIINNSALVANRILNTVSDWPNWRSYDESGLLAGFSTWDRGNWANGYFPAAVAIFSLFPGVDQTKYTTRFTELASNYVNLDFPPAKHWIRRSTNHAAIIYSGMIGASLLMNNCSINKSIEHLVSQYKELFAGSFRDGFYMESINYSKVFIPEGFFGPMVYSACRDKPLKSVLDSFYSSHLSDNQKISQILTTEGGNIWLKYGDDNPNTLWSEEHTSIMSLYDSYWSSIPVVDQALLPNLVARIKSIEAPPATPKMFSSCFLYEKAGVGTYSSYKNGLKIRLGVLSMPLHLTHNRNWDLGSLVLMSGEETLIGRNPDTYRHSSISEMFHSTVFIKEEPHVCHESEGPCKQRSKNGGLVVFHKGEDKCSFKVRSNDFSRVYMITNTDNLYVTIFDVLPKFSKKTIQANFNKKSTNYQLRSERIKINGHPILISQIVIGSNSSCDSAEVVKIENENLTIFSCDRKSIDNIPIKNIVTNIKLKDLAPN